MGIVKTWPFKCCCRDLVSHLNDSPWTLELEQTLERFSLSTYLNWFDHDYIEDDSENEIVLHSTFPEEFLNYLESKVSIPCSQIQPHLQLLMLIREILTFIIIILHVMWNMLCLPSTIPLAERKLGS